MQPCREGVRWHAEMGVHAAWRSRERHAATVAWAPPEAFVGGCLCVSRQPRICSVPGRRATCMQIQHMVRPILRTSGRAGWQRIGVCLRPDRPIALHAPILRGVGPRPGPVRTGSPMPCVSPATTPHFVKPGARRTTYRIRRTP